MSSRAKKRREARGEQPFPSMEELREKEAFHRATNPEGYFRAKVKVVSEMSRNGITPMDLEEEYHRGYKAGCDYVSKNIGTIYTSAMILTLSEQHNFTSEQLCTLMDRMNEYMVGTLTSEEAMQAVFDKFGMTYEQGDPFHPLQFKE